MQAKPVWEQQHDEASHVYEAARVYFELGPQRTLRAVARQCQKHPSTIAKWSARHNWRSRAQAYDHHRLQQQDAERQKVLQEVERAEMHGWSARMEQEREEEWQTARALLAKAREMLACPLEDAKWNWRDAGAMIAQAAKLVRQVADEAGAGAQESSEEILTVRVEYGDEEADGGEEE